MIKAYFIMRKDLGMTPAKLAVQVGHGTQQLMRKADYYELLSWEASSDSRKIVCEISSEEKMNNLYNIFKEFVTTCEIWDSGYTEFNGRTKTGICLLYNEDNNNKFLEQKLKRLQLYK